MSFNPLLATQSILSLLSGRSNSRKLQILIYHRVLEERDPLQPSEPTVVDFDWQMRLIKSHFNALPLEQAIRQLHSGELPPRAICVTFDDGYADNYSLAAPVIVRHQVPATIFVASGFLNGGIMFNDCVLECVRQYPDSVLDLRTLLPLGPLLLATVADKRRAHHAIINSLKYLQPEIRDAKIGELVALTDTKLPENMMMTDQQLLDTASSGISIGAHTVNHPILSQLDHDRAYREITEGRQYLEKLLNHPINLFAYPNGLPDRDYTDKHVQMIAELGFVAAVSTAQGHSTAGTNRFELRRFTPWDRTPNRFLLRLALNYLNS